MTQLSFKARVLESKILEQQRAAAEESEEHLLQVHGEFIEDFGRSLVKFRELSLATRNFVERKVLLHGDRNRDGKISLSDYFDFDGNGIVNKRDFYVVRKHPAMISIYVVVGGLAIYGIASLVLALIAAM